MSTFSRLKKVMLSFKYAIHGIRYAIRTERNMKLHLVCALAALFLAFLLNISKLEFLLVLLAIFFVLVLEMINTAIEATVDLVTAEAHPLARIAKDVASGAVLLAAIFACLIGLYVFMPPILKLMMSN